jgi:hypothetical protein
MLAIMNKKSAEIPVEHELPPQATLVSSPLVTRAKWAELVGLPVGVVTAQCDRGLLPTLRLGKYSLVNVEALRVLCARRAEEFLL